MSTGKPRTPRVERQQRAAGARKRIAQKERTAGSIDCVALVSYIDELLQRSEVWIATPRPVYGLQSGPTITVENVKGLLLEARDLTYDPSRTTAALHRLGQAATYLVMFNMLNPRDVIDRLDTIVNVK